jgi:signal transduction histidine kinase/DNA-binding LacI/PurR family transcriptional regulator/DNA-binding response OmpR family regulator
LDSHSQAEDSSIKKGFQGTVAYFSSSPGSSLSFEKWLLWRGMFESAQQWGINLIYVAGEEFEHHPQASLYELIGSHNVDGIIFWNSFFSRRTPIEHTQAFLERYHLPVVSIEAEIPGGVNLLIDNAQGIRSLLAHLVEEHGYRKIAFWGQKDSLSGEARRRAFEDRMVQYGLFDPRLIGSLAELDQRGLVPGVDYQALLAHTDLEATQAVQVLAARGVRIPEDVAVTGCNDGREARGLQPALTTIRLPFRRMGQEAMNLLARQLMGESVPNQTVLPLNISLRRSCGCLEPMAEQAAAGPMVHVGQAIDHVLAIRRRTIINGMVRSMGTSIESMSRSWASNLWDIFVRELNRHRYEGSVMPTLTFVRDLSSLLQQAAQEGGNISRWNEALTTLRQQVAPYLEGSLLDFAEDLFHQARVLVGQASVRAEVNRSWRVAQRGEILRELEAELLISFNYNEFNTLLVRGLSRLGIANLYMVLYENGIGPSGDALLTLAYQNGRELSLDPNPKHFPARQILPDGLVDPNQPSSMLLEALNLGEEQMGYLVFQVDPPLDSSECEVFQALRIQISSALKGIRLRLRLQDALREAEEANQLKSRFLSMVSHELRTPLNLIVGLSEMAMRQQSRSTKSALETLRKFLEQIYTSGQHLDRLIRDVLDLASSQIGQMQLSSHPLDLIPVLKDAACMGGQLAEQKNLAFKLDIPERLPLVYGDKTRLRQVLLNLLSNAVKFTAHGEVVLQAGCQDNQIVVSIMDTGLGIARADQEVIFDEFHQSDRTTVRGFGGIGLGLAITRRLVELHGGSIRVQSEGTEGRGSTFTFILPVINQRLPAEMEALTPRFRTVVILSQSPGASGPVAAYLQQHGFKVEELSVEAQPFFLADLLSNPPGAIVLDMTPASEQGWEIMKKIKENPATQDIPVLFYSLIIDQDAGAVVEMDYLTKPVGMEQLVDALKRHGLKDPGQKTAKKILVVDDDTGILELHTQMVQSQLPDAQVLTAEDGIQALAAIRAHRPDLVLLDLMMPELDGFGVLTAMQEDAALRSIPVIVLSGQVMTRREMARLNQGVTAVLGKGLFTTQEILSRIESALSRSRRLGSEAQRLVYQAMAYIHEHFKEPVSRSDIANSLYVNEQYLSRCFNKEIGIGPMAYLNRYRIQQAKRMLERGDLTITQVALEVGFSSQSYFSRLFQQETGLSPSAFQRGKRS